ncbi:MAG: alpha/beta fold hydrolase [Solirubrobacterales bacterium]
MEPKEFSVDRGSFELRGWSAGADGAPAVLCLHETAASAAVWEPLAAALGERVRVVAFDRRGWGGSGAPEDYRRTTIEEQAGDAEAVAESIGSAPVMVCGAGIGGVVALELALRRAELVAAAILIEPPLLGLVAEATPMISADAEAIRRETAAVGARLGEGSDAREAAALGAGAALDLYLSGELAAIGAGADRIPDAIADRERASPFALFAEVAAISGWTIPLAELPRLGPPATVVLARSTPPFSRRAAEALAVRLPGADLRELAATGLPQLDGVDELAAIVLEISR